MAVSPIMASLDAVSIIVITCDQPLKPSAAAVSLLLLLLLLPFCLLVIMSILQSSTDISFLSSSQRSPQVRFEDECVVIPDLPPTPSSSRLPRLVKKSYSVPVWRRRPSQSNEAVSDSELIHQQDDGRRVVIKVPVYR